MEVRTDQLTSAAPDPASRSKTRILSMPDSTEKSSGAQGFARDCLDSHVFPFVGLHEDARRFQWYAPRRVLATHSAIKPVCPVGQPLWCARNQAAVLSKLRFQALNSSAEVVSDSNYPRIAAARARPHQGGPDRLQLPPGLQRAARTSAVDVAKQETPLWPLVRSQCCNAAGSRITSRSRQSVDIGSLPVEGCQRTASRPAPFQTPDSAFQIHIASHRPVSAFKIDIGESHAIGE